MVVKTGLLAFFLLSFFSWACAPKATSAASAITKTFFIYSNYNVYIKIAIIYCLFCAMCSHELFDVFWMIGYALCTDKAATLRRDEHIVFNSDATKIFIALDLVEV